MSKSATARPTSYSRGRALRNRRIKKSCSALSTFDISAKKWCTDTPHGQAKRPFHTMFTLRHRVPSLYSVRTSHSRTQRTWRNWSLLVQIVRFTCPRRRTFSNATFASLQKGASCWRLITASRHSRCRCECLSNQHVFV
jgi:hypothetical protein